MIKSIIAKIKDPIKTQLEWILPILTLALMIIWLILVNKKNATLLDNTLILETLTHVVFIIIGITILVSAYLLLKKRNYNIIYSISIIFIVLAGIWLVASFMFHQPLTSHPSLAALTLLLPSASYLYVMDFFSVPSLQYEPIYIQSVEDQRGKRFQGDRGIIWRFTNISDEHYDYRLRVDKQRLSEPLSELFKATIGHQILNREIPNSIPLLHDGELLGWRLYCDDRISMNGSRSPLDPSKPLGKNVLFFNFLNTVEEKKVLQTSDLKAIRTIYVTCTKQKV